MKYLSFLVIGITWSMSFILMKRAGECWGPMGIAGWRCVSGAAFLVIPWLMAKPKPRLERKDWGAVVFLVLCSYVWPYTLQPIVIKWLGSACTAIIVSLVPLLTVAVSIPILRIYPKLRQLIGVVAGLGCMIMLLWERVDQENILLWKVLLAVTVPLSYAIGNTWNRKRLSHVSPSFLAAISMLMTSAILVPPSLAMETVRVDERFAIATASMLALGVIGTGVAIWLFYRLIQTEGPLFAGMVTYIVPTGALAAGYFDGEQLSWIQILSLVGILVTVAITTSAPTDGKGDRTDGAETR